MRAVEIMSLMAENNAWANDTLAAAIARLDDAAYRDATRTSFFPSIHVTLVHILYVDRYYLDALDSGGAGLAIFDDEDAFARDAPFARVHALQQAADRHLIDFTGRADLDARVRIERPDHIQDEAVADVLLHLFQHQVHHRGQVHAMLSGTPIPPPQLDEFFLTEDRKKIAN
jgi:uncharacterized damage-inducible protein DinB